MSDFSSEARAYCRQHGVYFYPNDAGCEQCERDIENIADEGSSENCVCDDTEELVAICDKYIEYNNPYNIIVLPHCAACGHLKECHENT